MSEESSSAEQPAEPVTVAADAAGTVDTAVVEPAAVAAAPSKSGKRTGRRIAAVVAVVLAVVLFLTATAAVWAKRTVLSADRVVAAVDKAAEDPAVIDALATRVTNEIVQLIDVSAIVQSVLPDQLDKVGPLLENALTGIVHDRVAAVIDSPTGRKVLETAVRKAHDAAIRILEGDGFGLDSFFLKVDGEVRLDTVPLVIAGIEALQDQGVIPGSFDLSNVLTAANSSLAVQALSKVFGVSVPEDFGQVTVLNAAQVETASSTLSTAQTALSVFKKGTVVLVILALLMIALALFVSVDRRRTLAQIVLGIGVGALLMRIAIDQVVAAIDRAIDKAGAKAAAVNITEELTQSLARVLVLLAVAGLIVGLVLWLLRPNKDGSASALTEIVRANPDIARFAVIGFGLLVLLVTGLGPIALILVIALVVGGVLFVNRQAAAAAPPAADA
ncbi:MAG: hypothetical protein ACOYMR_09380 [Ilumatobacteraceae bacterium]